MVSLHLWHFRCTGANADSSHPIDASATIVTSRAHRLRLFPLLFLDATGTAYLQTVDLWSG